jgi:cephalosporin hydroxylase
MSEAQEFSNDVADNVRRLGEAVDLPKKSLDWMLAVATTGKYTYNFTWMGRPIIQFPQDIVAMQELILSVRPDLIIETGIAHGGSLVLSASMLALLDTVDAIEAGQAFDPRDSRRKVLAIDIDIRAHNRAAIEAHPMASRIAMIQGSSVAPDVISQVRAFAGGYTRVLVFLDSNHTHEHVLLELQAYAPLTSKGSYCVVFDTLIEDIPADLYDNRPWGPGDNPKTAVWEYLRSHPEFEIDKSMQHRLQITVAPDGFLKRIA